MDNFQMSTKSKDFSDYVLVYPQQLGRLHYNTNIWHQFDYTDPSGTTTYSTSKLLSLHKNKQFNSAKTKTTGTLFYIFLKSDLQQVATSKVSSSFDVKPYVIVQGKDEYVVQKTLSKRFTTREAAEKYVTGTLKGSL